MRNQAAIILAAGKGTRMRSRTAKVLHEVAGVPMVVHVIREAHRSGIKKIAVVVGHQAATVRTAVMIHLPHIKVEWVLQTKQLGTAHAVKCARVALRDFLGDVWILSGDVPLISAELIRSIGKSGADSDLVVTSMTREPPGTYGRILRHASGELIAVREAADCSESESRVTEVNAGLYRVDNELLFECLGEIRPHNAQSEYYLTDIVEYAVSQSANVACVHAGSRSEELRGVNTLEDLAFVQEFAASHPERFKTSET